MNEMQIREMIENEKHELKEWLIPIEKELAFRNGRIKALEDLLNPPKAEENKQEMET